jgi:hypothetical protein
MQLGLHPMRPPLSDLVFPLTVSQLRSWIDRGNDGHCGLVRCKFFCM